MTLRNTIHDRLTDHFGRADWWASTSLLLDDITAEMLTEVVRKHQRKIARGICGPGKVIADTTRNSVSERDKLSAVVAGAWHSFDSAASLKSRVSPAIPILFFGDLDAHANSQPRVLTVGLNPSRNEFPQGDPFQRFPLAEDATAGDRQRYLDALSAYFRTRSCLSPRATWITSGSTRWDSGNLSTRSITKPTVRPASTRTESVAAGI